MALKRDTRYPGRFIAANTAHPQGAFKNRSTPTAQDGSYLEADWMNDIDGFFARILNVAGVTPNGTLDDGTASQLYDSLLAATPGRLLSTVRFTTNGTYTPSAGAKTIRVLIVGGGGGGGGTAATSSTQIASGNGGNAGTYGETTPIAVTSITSVPVTVGSGGTTSAGNAGGTGGTSSFGAFISAPGGQGGGAGAAGGAGSLASDNVSTLQCSGTSVSLSIAGDKGTGAFNISVQSNGIKSGGGGDSQFGIGGGGINGTTSPRPGTGFGAGGGGNAAGPGAASAISGAVGAAGVVIVMEYS